MSEPQYLGDTGAMNRELKARGLPEITCQVCDAEPAVGVAAVPGVPVSMAYGSNCLAANAHPYSILVINTAMCGGYDQTVEEWRKMVDDTLAHLGKAREQFDADVEREMEDQRKDEEDLRLAYEKELGHALNEGGAGPPGPFS
jgi:hypothetical protein